MYMLRTHNTHIHAHTNQHLGVSFLILLLGLGLFCTFVYVCMYVSVCIAKLTDSSRSLSTKSLISPPVQTQYVIQGMGGRRSVAEDESLRGSR